jgi:hypothetical protein
MTKMGFDDFFSYLLNGSRTEDRKKLLAFTSNLAPQTFYLFL